MRIIDLLQDHTLSKKNVLEKLICHHLGLTKAELFAQSDRELTPEDVDYITTDYHAYASDLKPLEYIIGKVEFLGVLFNVTPATLIPRPETEYMIEAVNEFLSQQETPTALIDVGTGCGVLGLSVLYHNPDKISELVLTELSEEALEVARENYERLLADNTTKVAFLEANLLDHPEVTIFFETNEHITLVANLPYIPDQMFDDNVEDNVKKREPRMAFVGGDDGLDLYREMFDQLENIEHNSDLTLFLEMMTRQIDILRKEYEKAFTFEEVKTFHFNIRIVRVRRR